MLKGNLDYFKHFPLIGENYVLPVRSILGQYMKKGGSAFKILGTIQEAIEGKYKVRGYTDDDFDLPVMVRRLGVLACFTG